MDMSDRSTVVVVTTGDRSRFAKGQRIFVVTGTFSEPHTNVKLRPRPTPCIAVAETCSVDETLCRLFPIRATVVELTVTLSLAFTVTLTLVRVRVGVLPTLLFVTVITWLLLRSLLMTTSPLLGPMLVRHVLTSKVLVMSVVGFRVLLAVTIIVILLWRSLVMVFVAALPMVLRSETLLVRRLLTVMRIIAVVVPAFIPRMLMLRACTNLLPFIRIV